jgi:dolichyl-phosphate-mannose-protein mannosyltransferase
MAAMLNTNRRRARIWVPAVVFLLASAVRLWSLSSPPTLYWDEQYYVFDAEVYLGGGLGQPVGHQPEVKIADEGTWMHPPLGKWVIALAGVGPLGLRSIGWRLPSALFGIAGVVLLYFMALRLWKSVWWAGLASLLLALDGLHIVQSRIAMLDIFLSTFILAAMLCLILDRERMDEPDERSRWRRTTLIFGSPYRFLTGFFLGAASATKWSGAPALLLALGCCAAWLFSGGRRGKRSTAATVGTLVTSFALVPLGVYLLSYGAFFYQHGPDVGDFLILQLRILQYHEHYGVTSFRNSAPWTWPLMLRPIQYYRGTAGGSVQTIVSVGNPALWWGFLLLLPVGAVTLARRASWREAMIFGGIAALYLPWLLVSRPQYNFYMLPIVPFMALGAVAILRCLQQRMAVIIGIGFAAAATLCAVAFLPAWTGWSVSQSWLDRLRWLPRWPL